jgi:hypothetical protein
MSRCPVCGGGALPLLFLESQPIYQHPVAASEPVPGPFSVDLEWAQCEACGHAWQREFVPELLESIYRNHYYTPAPGGMAIQFRDEFLRAMDDFGVLARRGALLEIGASDGDVLLALTRRMEATRAFAFEPNATNASVARQRGLTVYEKFFDRHARDFLPCAVEIALSRHVIEHLFDFDGFFAGIESVTNRDATLVLETPSLEHHAGRGSLAPFHVEHIHVFSKRSLARLARRFGWQLVRDRVTDDGNLIAVFARSEPGGSVSCGPNVRFEGLQAAVDALRGHLRWLVDGRPLVFWGAGSAAIGIVRSIGREPDYWTDGNPNKVGLVFPGCTREIVSPEEALAARNFRPTDRPLLVIASSFVREILPRVKAMGWAGEIVDMNGRSI